VAKPIVSPPSATESSTSGRDGASQPAPPQARSAVGEGRQRKGIEGDHVERRNGRGRGLGLGGGTYRQAQPDANLQVVDERVGRDVAEGGALGEVVRGVEIGVRVSSLAGADFQVVGDRIVAPEIYVGVFAAVEVAVEQRRSRHYVIAREIGDRRPELPQCGRRHVLPPKVSPAYIGKGKRPSS